MVSGLDLIREHLRDLLQRGGRLRFLTGDYLDVTQPDALRQLLDLATVSGGGGVAGPKPQTPDPNPCVSVRIFQTAPPENPGHSFHPKAYLFRHADGSGTALVGSSNLSATALGNGVEWNYRVITSRDRAGFASVSDAFEQLYTHPATRPLDSEWIEEYSRRYKPAPRQVPAEKVEPPPEPHAIQQQALDELAATRAAGNRAGLVVLATGLGKTWLSAFDSKGFRRVLS